MKGWKSFFLVKLIVAVTSCVLNFAEGLWNKRIMGIGSSSQNNSSSSEEKQKKKHSIIKEEKPNLNGQNFHNKKNSNEKKYVDKNKNNISSTLIKLVESSTQTENLVSNIKETLKLFAKQTQTDLENILSDSFVQTELNLNSSCTQTDIVVENEKNHSFTQTVTEEKEIESKNVEVVSSSFSQQTETVFTSHILFDKLFIISFHINQHIFIFSLYCTRRAISMKSSNLVKMNGIGNIKKSKIR